MEAWPRWSQNTLQRLWTSLRQIDTQTDNEAVTGVEWVITETEVNGWPLAKIDMIEYPHSAGTHSMYTMIKASETF